MLGDGVTDVLKCEFAEEKEDGREGDSGVVECEFHEEHGWTRKQLRWYEQFLKVLDEPLNVEETLTNENADLGYEHF